MAIRLNYLDPYPLEGVEKLSEWDLPARPAFMESRAYETLEREMERYLRGEISGRSVLIAAHRGNGKTTLALRAVETLERKMLRAVARSGEERGVQRPLLVKLHASALDSAPDLALKHLASSLYRALAKEATESFARHARGGRGSAAAKRELAERSAQLRLDLDVTPDLAALRSFWHRLGKLGDGVLWPSREGGQPTSGRPPDRGMLELAALATANGAFLKCAGKLEDTLKSGREAERSREAKQSIALDGKELANKLWGLAAGTLAGGAVWAANQPILAAAAGVGVALFGTLVLNLSESRKLRQTRSTEHVFLPDHDLATLDRDLPVVIERIRAVGLAPIFVIDELDKLDEPHEFIETILNRLKNLVTDFGFFCFLADRDYYDEVEAKVRARLYPKEHSYFSHRLLLAYQPAEMAHYVRKLWRIESPAGDPRREEDAASVLTAYALHESRLNLIDLNRVLARLDDKLQRFALDAGTITGSMVYLLPMAVQLAIDHVLHHPSIRHRIEEDAGFAQIVVEVMYFITRAWIAGAESVTIDYDTIKQELLRRRGWEDDASEEADRAEAALRNAVSDRDLALLANKIRSQAQLLTDFSNLAREVLGSLRDVLADGPRSLDGTPAATRETMLTELVPILTTIPGGLLRKTNGQDSTYSFRYDRFGISGEDRLDQEAAEQGINAWEELDPRRVDGILDFDILTEFGIVPRNLNPVALRDSVQRIRVQRIRRNPRQPDLVTEVSDAAYVQRLTSLGSAIGFWRPAIVRLGALALNLEKDAGERPNRRPVVQAAFRAIDRFFGTQRLAALAVSTEPASARRPISRLLRSSVVEILLQVADRDLQMTTPSLTASVRYTREELRENGLTRPPPEHDAPARWRQRVSAWLGARPIDPIDYGDLVHAAAVNRPIQSALRPDLDRMTVAEWSEFCMLAFTEPLVSPYRWGVSAALCALGFGREAVVAAGDREFEAGASAGGVGVIRVYEAADKWPAVPPDRAQQPVFAVPFADRIHYADLAKWLTEHKFLELTE
jgi:hypothetical protein